jgi:hypothetical protein
VVAVSIADFNARIQGQRGSEGEEIEEFSLRVRVQSVLLGWLRPLYHRSLSKCEAFSFLYILHSVFKPVVVSSFSYCFAVRSFK